MVKKTKDAVKQGKSVDPFYASLLAVFAEVGESRAISSLIQLRLYIYYLRYAVVFQLNILLS